MRVWLRNGSSGPRVFSAWTKGGGLLMAALLMGAFTWRTAAEQAPAAPPASAYIGPEVCIKCHGELARAWLEVSHSQALMATDRPPELTGCEACHGPGRAHATTNRKAMPSWDSLTRAQRNGTCLKDECHPSVTAANWEGGPHDRMRMECTTCHEVHKVVPQSQLLKQPEDTMCYGCHGNVKLLIENGQHHVVTGFLKCGTCHDPHAKTVDQHLLKIAPPQLCRTCHGPGGIKPASHKQPGWPGNHGQIAKPDVSKCTQCHDEQTFCDACHGLRMPHPSDWLPTGHAATASFAANSVCFKCHQMRLCQVCHLREEPSQQ